MAIQIDRRKSCIEYDSSGLSIEELLPGTYGGGIRSFRCSLKAGSDYNPELYGDKTAILFFGMGRGYLTDEKDAYQIEELSFYAPDFDNNPYTIHAIEDMEFVMSIVEMNEWDWEVYHASHARLPFFRPISK